MTPQEIADRYGYNLLCSHFKHKVGDIAQTDGSGGILHCIHLVIIGEVDREEAVRMAASCNQFLDRERMEAPYYYKVVVE